MVRRNMELDRQKRQVTGMGHEIITLFQHG